MRKLVVVLVIVALVVGGAVFAVSNFNSYLHDNREWLAEKASAAVGRPVTFDSVGVSFRGGLGAGLTNLSIGDDPAYSKGNFVDVGEANVVVKILPALTGRYEVERLVLVAPTINIVKRASGFNFDTIGGAAAAEPAAGDPPPGGPADGVPPAARDAGGNTTGNESSEALPFLVSILEIREGRVRFVDETTSPASEVVVDRIDFSASDVGFDAPVTLDLAAAVLGASEQNVRLSGSIGPLGSPADAGIAPLDLDLEVGPVVVDRAKKLAMVGASIPAELSSPDPMTVRVAVAGRLDAPQVTASLDATDAALSFGEIFRKPRGTRLSVRAKVASSADSIIISDLELSLAKATVRGNGTIATGASQAIDFRIIGEGVPLDGWGALLPAAEGLDVGGAISLDIRAKQQGAEAVPTIRGTVGLENVRVVQPGGGIEISGLTTKISVEGDRITIPSTDLKVAGEPVTVSATVASVKNLAGDFALSAAQLRLAALGVAGEQLRRPEIVRDVALEGTFAQGTGGPRLRATLRSSAGSVRDVEYANLGAEFAWAEQRAELDGLSIEAFDGTLTGDAVYDMSRSKPTFSFRGKLNGLDVTQIVAYLDLASTVTMTGKVRGALNLDGSGSEQEEIASALVGDGFLWVDDGVIPDVNIAGSILSAVAGAPGLVSLIGPSTRTKYRELFERGDTTFDKLGGKLEIGDGRIDLRELTMAASDYRIDGAGSVGFDKKVDINAEFVASEVLTGDLVSGFEEVKYLLDQVGRFSIPIEIVGTLPDVSARPDLDFVSARLAGALVTEGLEKGLDALFGGGEEKPPSAADGAAAAEDGGSIEADKTRTKPSTEERLLRGLGGLLGGKKDRED